jgi:L-threonylcarbamoyladenylate synthase
VTARLVPPADAVGDALAELGWGGLVAFPTDTVYALACRADDPEAIARFYRVKGRPTGQPSILLAHDLDALRQWVSFDRSALGYAEEFWPGPLTLILPLDRARLDGAPTEVRGALESLAADGTIGVRVPDHVTARELLAAWGMPLCTSSANRAGEPPTTTGRGVVDSLGEEVSVVIDGDCPLGRASSILDLTRAEAVVLREGTIPATRLLR